MATTLTTPTTPRYALISIHDKLNTHPGGIPVENAVGEQWLSSSARGPKATPN